MDQTDSQIVALLLEDARRPYGDIAKRVSLSAPAVKRRVDRMRASGALRGFTAVLDPGVVEAWSVTGEPDAVARVRTRDNADLERVIMEIQKEGPVERTRSQVVL